MATITETIVDAATGETITRQVEDTRQPVVPQLVENWQGLAVMRTSTLPSGQTYDAAVRAAIAGLPAPQNDIVLAAYESARFVRTSPTLNQLLGAIGLTQAQIDALFIQADGLSL